MAVIVKKNELERYLRSHKCNKTNILHIVRTLKIKKGIISTVLLFIMRWHISLKWKKRMNRKHGSYIIIWGR